MSLAGGWVPAPEAPEIMGSGGVKYVKIRVLSDTIADALCLQSVGIAGFAGDSCSSLPF